MVLSFLALDRPAFAHELQPAIADLVFSANGSGFELSIALNAEAVLAEIGPEHDNTENAPNASIYDALRALSPDLLSARFEAEIDRFLGKVAVQADGVPIPIMFRSINITEIGDLELVRSSKLVVGGALPANTQSITFAWDTSLGDVVLRGPLDVDGNGYSGFLQAGDRSAEIAVTGRSAQNGWDVFLNYIFVGFDHIVPKGLDHILFVVGLFLLSARLKPLLWQVTAFTIAHSITLALGILGLVNLPASLVEPLIAASIIYICVENLFFDHLSRWRSVVIFMFGLLHGLGFASVLSDFGLSQGNFIAGLVGFNIGVEFGQITVILICFAMVGYWFRDKPWYRPGIIVPGSLIIAAIGTFWFLERTVLA